MRAWKLTVTASAERDLARLPERFAAAVIELLVGPLVELPERLGKPLHDDLAGTLAARRGPYRVVYRLDVDAHAVVVLRIDHRADVYRARLQEAAALAAAR